ncbi:MAG: DNA replication/repair protein RecF [Gemmatimonadetes bacterium]|nr:DNA replication/repair protein RecF [Gemmatimonadota bacterium]
MSAVASSAAFRKLRLRNFRNFAELELSFPPAGVAVIGDNGTGKTNLLEALYYLEIFRSFRGAPDEQLVRFGEEVFHVRGVLDGAGSAREIEAAFERRSRRKRVAVNGAEPDRLGDALGGVGVVIFSPADMTLVAGAPGDRRRFLDIVLSLNRPGYLGALQRYRQILKHRNAMLRSGGSDALLAAWDEGLAEWGGRVVAWRAEWIAEIAPGFARRYAAIAGGQTARVAYASSVPLGDTPPGAEAAAEAFRAELARLGPRERERGMTLVGPHRDDLAILLQRDGGEAELRDFGSGGQQRTAAIALRMVEAETVRSARGREPVVLLDDVFAELDPGRSGRILELLEDEERGQVILTAPKESDLELRRGSLAHWRIEAGAVLT